MKIGMIKMMALLIPLVHCTLDPPIMQTQAVIDINDVALNANTVYTRFEVSGNSTSFTMTFLNEEGDSISFTLSGVNTSYNMSSVANSMTATYALSGITVIDNDVGNVNITGITGTPPNITAISGDFQVDVRAPDQVGFVGVITGVFNFVQQ